ncbi:MAG TPA: hypothetical protein VF529_23090 [Solirubrobacteraceae bacterium]|jgi:hypothetical protein
MRRRAVVAALVAGALAGAVAAAVAADDESRPVAATARSGDPRPVPIAAPQRHPGRLPDGRYDPSRVHYRVHRPKIAVRVPDPAGGPAWAVKVFDAERISLRRPARSLRRGLIVGRNRCAQVGRLRDGAFGWVFGDGRFRRIGLEDRLVQCTSRRRPEPEARIETTLRIEDPAAPEPAATIVWGLAPGATEVRVAGFGNDGPAATRFGAFLRVGGADDRPRDDARLLLGGRTVPLGGRRAPSPGELGGGHGLRFPTPIPGTERIEARAPDPAGGPGYGILVAETREGQPCGGGEGQVVGDRIGGVDLALGLFYGGETLSGQACRPLDTAPTPERACDVGTGFRNAEELEGNDLFLRRARIERRLLAGRTTIRAQCHPAVERVTLQTPRDVRTLIPSPVGHVILAVYDGDFPGGDVLVTARLRGGRTWRERVPLGF